MTSLPTSRSGALASIPFGPGPQDAYAVRPQPPAGSCRYRYTASKQPLPDPACTGGARNPAVTQATLATTVCKPGYTASIRPSASITGKEKTANASSYGYAGSMGQAEYDHLISLELGGDPNSPQNLWVEPPSPQHQANKGVSNPKDAIETHLKALVCHYVHLASQHQGTATSYLPLATAQSLIVTDWTTAMALSSHDLVAK